MLAGGCSQFAGQWVEEGTLGPNGELRPPEGARRMALEFHPPGLVRVGQYIDRSGVVDAESVQSDQYTLFDGNRSAQFGAIIARLEGGRLIAHSGGVGEPERRYVRVHGRSVFPPRVTLEALALNTPDASTSQQSPQPEEIFVSASAQPFDDDR